MRRLQVAGATRLQTFGSRLVHEGVDAARGALGPAAAVEAGAALDDDFDHSVGFGAAFSDDASFDELDDLGRRERGVHVRFLATFRSQVAAVVLVAVLFAVGVRNLVASHLPLVGRLAPLDSWWTTWRHFFASWTPSGIGTGAPAMPGFGVLGFAGPSTKPLLRTDLVHPQAKISKHVGRQQLAELPLQAARLGNSGPSRRQTPSRRVAAVARCTRGQKKGLPENSRKTAAANHFAAQHPLCRHVEHRFVLRLLQLAGDLRHIDRLAPPPDAALGVGPNARIPSPRYASRKSGSFRDQSKPCRIITSCT